MLAALPEHQHLFRTISHNSFLMADLQSLSLDALRHRAWDVAQPQQEARQAAWYEEAYVVVAGQGLGSEDSAQVAYAAVAGRVAILLVEAERQVTGRIDPADLDNPRADDVLDDLGALVERMGGEFHILPAERMSSHTGVAALFRHWFVCLELPRNNRENPTQHRRQHRRYRDPGRRCQDDNRTSARTL